MAAIGTPVDAAELALGLDRRQHLAFPVNDQQRLRHVRVIDVGRRGDRHEQALSVGREP